MPAEEELTAEIEAPEGEIAEIEQAAEDTSAADSSAEAGESPEAIEIPETEDELRNLTREQIKDLEKRLLEEDFDEELEGEAADDGEMQGAGESAETNSETYGIDPEIFAELPESVVEKLQDYQGKLAAMGNLADPEVAKGFSKFAQDPLIKDRLEVLLGNKEVADDPMNLVTEEAIKSLGLDFEYDAQGSFKRLAGFAQKLVNEERQRSQRIVDAEQHKLNVRKQVFSELDKISAMDPGFKSTLPYDHAEHPGRPFFVWLNEQREIGIDITKLGGESTYLLYLQKTGKLQERDKRLAAVTRKNVQAGIEKVKGQARTLGKSVSGKGPGKNMYGNIDIKRFQDDPVYQQKVYEANRQSPKMRALMEDWAG